MALLHVADELQSAAARLAAENEALRAELSAAAEDKLWAAVRSVLESGPPKKKAKSKR